MQIFVPLSYFVYVIAFVICQQIIGIRYGARNVKRKEYPAFLLYLSFSQALVVTGLLTMVGEPLNNLMVIRVAGLAVVALGLALSMSAQRELGKYWVGGIALHDDHKLIITGPYKYVRHPIYSGMLLSAIGLCFVSLNPLYGLGCFVFAGAYALRIFQEDELLHKRFKKHHTKYETQTGAIFPHLRK